MTPSRARRPCLLAFALAPILMTGPASALPAQAADVVVQKDGVWRRGVEIASTTATAVVVRTDGGERTLPAAAVAELRFGDLDEDLRDGFAALAAGDDAGAARALASGKPRRPVVAAEVGLALAKARLRAAGGERSDLDAAAAALRGWLAGHPDHFRTPEALWLSARAERLAGDAAAARAAIDRLDHLDRRGDDAAFLAWRVRGRLELAATATVAGDRAAATAAADTALALLAGAPAPAAADAALRRDLAVQARAVAGEAALAAGDLAAARTLFAALAADHDPALRATGLCGEGQALLAQASTARAAEPLHAAELLLARASVVDPLAGDTAAKTAVLLARVARALGDRDADEGRARAEQYLRSALRADPDGRWAAAARQELRR
jgi:hypothetical protein